MKAVFIAYSQAYGNEIVELLDKNNQRGFTRWSDVGGRGSVSGNPHYGDHAWPEMNFAILAMVEDAAVPQLLEDLKAKDQEFPNLGLRTYVWNIESAL